MIYNFLLSPEYFKFNDGVKFLKTNYNIWIVLVLCYLPFCQILEKSSITIHPKILKGCSVLWNFSLSLFSIIGSLITVPFLLKCLSYKGYSGTLVQFDIETKELCNYRENSTVAFWSFLFVLSKIPEFIDTFLYVLRNKRQHIFLHWYHHLATAVYSYMLVTQHPEPSRFGLWMVSLNYFVHSFMYLYYGLSEFQNIKNKLMFKKFANLITTIQILQMIIILYIIGFDYYVLRNEFETFGFTMYLIYSVLFMNLYIKKYSKKNN